jgi:hypothetical protein
MPDEVQNMSDTQLEQAYWYVTHKVLLKKILIITLIVIDAALLLFAGYGLTNYYFLEAGKWDAAVRELAAANFNPEAHRALVPQPLNISAGQVIAGAKTQDFIAQVNNPNATLGATFTYRFHAGSDSTDSQHGFILPGEQKYVVTLGAKLASRPTGATLELTDLVWRRIDRHKIPDYAKFASDRLDIPITDVLFDPAFQVDAATTVGRTTFSVSNNTGFTYYAARFLIIQFRGTVIGAVNTVTLADLKPRETRLAEVTWFDPLPAISKVQVVPDIDILDPVAYGASL